jgi:hypothetical protein
MHATVHRYATTNVVEAWATTVGILLGLVLLLSVMGYDVTASLASAAHGIEHFLAEPLSWA